MKPNASEAIELIRKRILSKEAETIDIFYAHGRTLAENIISKTDYPPFPRSPYDGYALRAGDTEKKKTFTVIGSAYAGIPFEGKIGELQTVKIMTGGLIPEGADCVIPWEESDRGEKNVNIFAAPKRFDNYIRQGEDFKQGELLLKSGTQLLSSEIALAVAGGAGKVKVYPKLKASVVSTGDELTAPGGLLKKGKIYDTNMIYIKSRLIELGIDVAYANVSPDDRKILTEAVLDAVKASDVVFTTGGVSAGEKDFIPGILKSIGADMVFEGVNIKPGMPTVFSILNNTPVLALSGNPFAAAVGFELFGREVLASLSGNFVLLPLKKTAVMKNSFNKKSGMERYLKAFINDGFVFAPDSQGNGSLRSVIGCNCLIRIPAGTESLKAGDVVEVLYG